MLARNILTELQAWTVGSNRKPLIIRGARQVGKTTVVDLLSKQYRQYIKLNLELPEEAAPFRSFTNIEALTEQLFFLQDKDIGHISETLLFIDEIQEVPEAINLLRYFYEKIPQLHVIAAGSLLETAIKGDVKIPVGRVEYLVVRPISFDEFLQATGDKAALEQFRKIPMNDYAHEKLISLFHTYTLIGGMPAIVTEYLTNKNLTALTRIYESLIVSYINDVEKYGRTNGLIQTIRHVIQASYLEAGSRIKFMNFGNSNYKSKEVGEAMRTLEKVMLLHLIYPTTNTSVPVVPDFKKSPRLQVLDTGMLNYFAGLQKEIIGTKDLDSFYQGKIAEHIVGQELLTLKSSVLNNLNFWVRQKADATAEVDFVVQYNGLIIPIEVKSGSTGSLRSLHLFMESSPHSYAVRLYNGPIQLDKLLTPAGKKFFLLNLPYYLVAHIHRYIEYMIDLSAHS